MKKLCDFLRWIKLFSLENFLDSFFLTLKLTPVIFISSAVGDYVSVVSLMQLEHTSLWSYFAIAVLSTFMFLPIQWAMVQVLSVKNFSSETNGFALCFAMMAPLVFTLFFLNRSFDKSELEFCTNTFVVNNWVQESAQEHGTASVIAQFKSDCSTELVTVKLSMDRGRYISENSDVKLSKATNSLGFEYYKIISIVNN